MMGNQDVGQSPSRCFEGGLDGCGFGRINRRRGAGRGVVQQHTVIVLKTPKKMCLSRHGCTPSLPQSVAAPVWNGHVAVWFHASLAGMSLDVVDLRNFYGQRLGTVARRFVGRSIRALW